MLLQQVLRPDGGVTVIWIALPSGGFGFQLMSVYQLSIDGGRSQSDTNISSSGAPGLRSKYEPVDGGPNTVASAACWAGVMDCGRQKITSKSHSAWRNSGLTGSLSGWVRSTLSVQAADLGMRGTGVMCL